MGGHGGLNILPQKRWNVYNFDNREKVRKDEEAAAKEEQLKREESRKRDTEFRVEQLRTARGLAPLIKPTESEPKESEPKESEPKESAHINLFEGIRIFDPIKVGLENKDKKKGDTEKIDGFNKKLRKMIKKEEPKVVTEEDEKYRLGYGLAGKGVKLPWYLEKPIEDLSKLREERLRREKREKERERALVIEKSSRGIRDGANPRHRNFSSRIDGDRDRDKYNPSPKRRKFSGRV
uniref:CBF1-interacting co-repressor CIR N-terminal domain-containing protein n=1 Tax=Cannabis sativa TaxID=3483 RepID=A0A803PPD6_CANSA